MALQTDPKLGDVRLKLGDAYLRANEPGNGLREYVRAADLLPNSLDAQVKAGQMLLVARAFEDARARADKAIALDAKSVDAQVLRGNALAGLKDFDAAVAEYQDAIALDPSQNAAYSNLGHPAAGPGQTRSRRKRHSRRPSRRRRNRFRRVSRSPTSSGRQGIGRAPRTTLKAALQIDVKDIAANRALGLFYMASGRVPEAEPYFDALAKVHAHRRRLARAGRLLHRRQARR